jgi:hypothetical protein
MFSKKKSVVEIFHSFRIINFELNVEELDEFQILPPTRKKGTKQKNKIRKITISGKGHELNVKSLCIYDINRIKIDKYISTNA